MHLSNKLLGYVSRDPGANLDLPHAAARGSECHPTSPMFDGATHVGNRMDPFIIPAFRPCAIACDLSDMRL